LKISFFKLKTPLFLTPGPSPKVGEGCHHQYDHPVTPSPAWRGGGGVRKKLKTPFGIL